MQAPVKLSVLVEALEIQSENYRTYYDRQTGEIVHIEDSLFAAVEEGDEEHLAGVPGWQKAEIEVARAVIADQDQRFLDPPDRFEFHEYRQMERFIESVADPKMAEQLWRAIRGAGAFRHFKDTLYRLGLTDAWFQFRDKAMKEFVKEWAEDNNVSYVDDFKKI